ncbi:MAG: D-alanine--D-alanine ligase [Deltaproteobacteria bacterium]|nr:D-alanine--D-alanine ligase [Deltaproteobacteria bacterium]
MKIALTYDVRVHGGEGEAEYDDPSTIRAIVASLQRLGHHVDEVEAGGPSTRVVARLEASTPDLVLNIAEGRRGRLREAFYPALLAELGLPFTGSDAYACAISLDKSLTKLKLERAGVPVPRGVFHDGSAPFDPTGLRLPLIVKPNFEGSSVGIGPDSIVTRLEDLAPRVERALAAFPEGVVVEEYVEGKDVVVALLERPRGRSVLPPAEYVYPAPESGFSMYDYARREQRDDLEVRAPADLPSETRARVEALADRAFRALGARDFGQLDFRVTPAGEVFFLEVDPLPSLADDGTFMALARGAGLPHLDAVLSAIIASACARQGVAPRPSRSKRNALRVGLAFNLKRIKPGFGGVDDDHAEYDSPTTVGAIRDAIASHGHEVVDLEATPELAGTLGAMGVDLVFNVAEGQRGRNRESQVPALCELLGIPYTGSDPATLAIALDKGLAKRICRQAGVRTPDWFFMKTGKEKIPKGFEFPLIVKPVAEGSSKGVLGSAVARDERALREKAAAIAARYQQPALVEAYLPGREFTVALLGERRPRVLPPMEIVFTRKDVEHPVYEFDHKLEPTEDIRYESPARIPPELQRDIEGVARDAFVALGCRDVARVDVRLDGEGHAHFIECNPLPGLTPDWSDICLIGKGVGLDYRSLIGEIMAPAIRRLKDQQRSGA